MRQLTFVGKFIRIFLICITFLTFLTFSTQAHSGRTDSNGGHHDWSDGSYHYHHGKRAHQHKDGKCSLKSEYTIEIVITAVFALFIVVGFVVRFFDKK